MKRLILPLLAGALLASGCAATERPPARAGEQASIPFLNHGGVYNWTADGNEALYIEDDFHRWYHATLFGPCSRLPFSETIGFETRGSDTLDNFGTVVVHGERCPIRTFVNSAPPPKEMKRHKRGRGASSDSEADREPAAR